MAGKRCADLPASPQPPRKKFAFIGTPCSRPSLASIPDDLTIEILSRLPAKSAARLKCVCKGWLAVISSRRFADAHRELSKPRPRMLILPCEYSPEKKTAFSMRFYEYNGGLASSEQFPTGIGRWTQPLHCDGLILTSTSDQEIMVRNLLTGEFVFLPKGSQNQEQHHRVGFGFDPRSRKYKAARYFYQRQHGVASESVCRFEVLTLGTNSFWRRTADPPYPIRAVTPAHARGFIYRRVDLPDEISPDVFIRFSLADETFSLIPYPPCDAQPVGFVELEGELCCACFAKPCEVVEIWACDDTTDAPAWTRRLVVPLPPEVVVPVPGGLFRCPKVAFHGKDLLFVIADRELFRYNIGNATMRKVPVAIKDLWYYQPDRNNHLPYSGKKMTFETVNYVESLVQISEYT
ncbi:hypothetical protein VPH35_027783 [Triticum aestivum]|uniref:putative F-box protein At4g09190 n=1 Tax=Triticum aestivum TaxID=4565 RepID=UPI001D006CC7|nr:putative F-box protein At4g09190 [Triticum aestivum]